MNERKNNEVLKLHIGGTLSVVETALGGNMLESLKIMKQTGTPYTDAIKNLYNRNGIRGLMYTGYFPYGMTQAFIKGIPFFYTHISVKEYLEKTSCPKNIVMGVSGLAGGCAQGFVIAPTQRIKALMLVNEKLSVKSLILQEKFNIFRGVHLLSLRRSLDWGLRLYTMQYVTSYTNFDNKNLNLLVSSGVGGMMGIFTLPLDVIISKYQTSNTRLFDLMKDIVKNQGLGTLTKGLVMRVFYSGWHTMWVAGVGTILYEKYMR